MFNPNFNLANPVCAIANLYLLCFMLRAVMSWFPISPGSPVLPLVRFLARITEPVLAPFRRVIPPMGMFDVSFLVAFVVLSIVINAVICPNL
jgi:YggT family protein